MITYEPVRVLFRIFGINIYSWGFFVSFGILVALLAARKTYKKKFEEILNSFLITFIFSIIGARIVYVLLNIKHFYYKPLEILNFQGGGLSFFGALFFGLLGFIMYFKIRKIDFREYLDIYAVFIPLVQAFGRIGCFLNGCCYGNETKIFFGIKYLGEIRHPAQIYESLLNFISFLFIYKIRNKDELRIKKIRIKFFNGILFLIYLINYSAIRFLVEFFREEQRLFLGLTKTQYLCLFIILTSGFIIYKNQKKELVKKKIRK
ncbi:MAG: prolipoprotein diacylglyceryl transferase [Candidatus Woesearchaeota archaeon]